MPTRIAALGLAAVLGGLVALAILGRSIPPPAEQPASPAPSVAVATARPTPSPSVGLPVVRMDPCETAIIAPLRAAVTRHPRDLESGLVSVVVDAIGADYQVVARRPIRLVLSARPADPDRRPDRDTAALDAGRRPGLRRRQRDPCRARRRRLAPGLVGSPLVRRDRLPRRHRDAVMGIGGPRRHGRGDGRLGLGGALGRRADPLGRRNVDAALPGRRRPRRDERRDREDGTMWVAYSSPGTIARYDSTGRQLVARRRPGDGARRDHDDGRRRPTGRCGSAPTTHWIVSTAAGRANRRPGRPPRDGLARRRRPTGRSGRRPGRTTGPPDGPRGAGVIHFGPPAPTDLRERRQACRRATAGARRSPASPSTTAELMSRLPSAPTPSASVRPSDGTAWTRVGPAA